jgi:hypothetical protein
MTIDRTFHLDRLLAHRGDGAAPLPFQKPVSFITPKEWEDLFIVATDTWGNNNY